MTKLLDDYIFVYAMNVIFANLIFVIGKWIAHLVTIMEKIKLAFDDNGISTPYPQMDVHLSKER